MTLEHLEVLVEEPSMEAALAILLPGILGNVTFSIHPFLCKQDLIKKLPARLLAYKKWLPDNWKILVVLDRDNENCVELKQKLEAIAENAGLKTRSSTHEGDYQLVNRLAIEELEAWYFGDWTAVRAAFSRTGKTVQQSARYRDPDSIKGGTWEAFERVMQASGYFKTGLRKIEAARKIAVHMVPERNSSKSFRVFFHTLSEMVAQ